MNMNITFTTLHGWQKRWGYDAATHPISEFSIEF